MNKPTIRRSPEDDKLHLEAENVSKAKNKSNGGPERHAEKGREISNQDPRGSAWLMPSCRLISYQKTTSTNVSE